MRGELGHQFFRAGAAVGTSKRATNDFQSVYLNTAYRVSSLFTCCVAAICVAKTAVTAELPVETFFRNYQYNEVKLCPDGNYLGVLAPDSNRVGLAVIDLNQHKANWAFADR